MGSSVIAAASMRLRRLRPLLLIKAASRRQITTRFLCPRQRLAITTVSTSKSTMHPALRPYVQRIMSAWNPIPARYMSLLQELYGADGDETRDTTATDGNSQSKRLEAITAKAVASMGLDEFATDMLPALKVLAESLQIMGQSASLTNWTSGDWLLGLTVMAQHNTIQMRKATMRPPRMATASDSLKTPERRALLEELLRFVRICDAVYADTTEQFCEEAKLPMETVVRSFNGSILSPKFMLLRNDATKEIVLVVRGTASILDFCTDICLINEPFADGQGHRGMVHAAKWLVKNVREDLERLTTENPDYKLVITGHSLGAGVSALAAMELKPAFPELKCIAFATPASVTENLATACEDFVTSVVNGDDCVPRLHQHSMMQLQGEVSKFDWRTALKQIVDEEIEEQKTAVKKKHDQQVLEIQEAFKALRASQEKQAKDALTQVMQTPVGRRVSASLELTKAAFWTDQPAMERLASVKQVVLKQKTTGDDTKLWESIESTVTGLEKLASALSRPQDLQAILTKSKVLLASTGYDPVASTAGGQDVATDGDAGAPETSSMSADLAAFRYRIKSVIDQTSLSLQADVQKTIDGVSTSVATSVQAMKDDAEAAIESQTSKLEASVAEFHSDVLRTTDNIVKHAQETALGVAAIGPLLKEFDVSSEAEDSLDYGDADGVDADEQDVIDELTGQEPQEVEHLDQSEAIEAMTEIIGDIPETSPPEELLHEPLFPPGRILYLNRLLSEQQSDQEDVELLHVANDEFSRVVLSNRMILDHLCTTYERVLQATAKSLDDQQDPQHQSENQM